jgi:hypothetical protein
MGSWLPATVSKTHYPHQRAACKKLVNVLGQGMESGETNSELGNMAAPKKTWRWSFQRASKIENGHEWRRSDFSGPAKLYRLTPAVVIGNQPSLHR